MASRDLRRRRVIGTVLCALSVIIAAAEATGSEAVALRHRYLLFPIRTGAPSVRVALAVDGRSVREFDAEIAAAADADFWAYLDVTPFLGKPATLSLGDDRAGFDRVRQADDLPAAANLYNEQLRPQFHFSQRVGWNNDPNGLVYYDGEWHLFFQHNPYGRKWGNMHWGHAVSRDLVHWQQMPIAIYNRQHGDWAFSGGAVVDERNTGGWQQGPEKVIVASFTSTGRGECLAYSNDRGRTFVEFAGNPVVRHNGRDPKIIWHEPSGHWVMAVYDEPAKDVTAIAFYTSPDLKQWTLASKLPGYFECPEIFELPVDADRHNTRWVVFAADAKYAVGKFDGRAFTPEHEGKHQLHFGAYYASQTFSNAPAGRRIQIGWARIDMPHMPFNQAFTFPHELTLRTTADGIRLHAEPISEINTLHEHKRVVVEQPLNADEPVNIPVTGELFDIRATLQIGAAHALTLELGGDKISYDATADTLNGAALKLENGEVFLQVLVDRPLLEVCAGRGRVVITAPRATPGPLQNLRVTATGGGARLLRLEINELKSIWNNGEPIRSK